MKHTFGAAATATTLFAALCAAVVATPVLAGNGMNGYGTGGISMGMAGADLAVPNGIYSIATNPAGLAGIDAHEASGFAEAWWQALRHRDDLGNDADVDNPIGKIFGGGYAQTLGAERRFIVGIAGFAQGGVGFIYRDLRNQLGAPDEMSALFGVFRLAPALAWRASEELTLGASLGINYSAAKQKVLPNTSLPSGINSPGFQGLELDQADGVTLNGKLGLLYRPVPAWTLALNYTSETRIKLEGGSLVMNYEADGLGRVRYRHAGVSGLALPAELGFGVAHAPSASWLLTAEMNWVNWSSAVQRSTLSADSPDRDGVPATQSFTSELGWRDQYVVAVGGQYQWSPRTQLRFGYNYGRNPIPNRTLSPLFNLISEHAVGVGIGYALPAGWQLDSSLLGSPFRTVHYSNPTLALGTAQEERFAVVDLNLTLTRRW